MDQFIYWMLKAPDWQLYDAMLTCLLILALIVWSWLPKDNRGYKVRKDTPVEDEVIHSLDTEMA